MELLRDEEFTGALKLDSLIILSCLLIHAAFVPAQKNPTLAERTNLHCPSGVIADTHLGGG